MPPSSRPDRPANEDSSTGSSAADGIFADAGPAFDPETPPPVDDRPEEVDGQLADVAWTTQRVKTLLTAQGEVLHGVAAVDRDSDEWRWLDNELTAVAAPLTNVLNRYDATRAAAAASDELAVAVGFGAYVFRSYGERRAILAELAPDAEPEPVSGVRAPEGSGPAEPATEAEAIPPIGGHR